MARAEVERDVARYEGLMARMDVVAAGSPKTQVESELAKVQNALAVSKEANWKADDDASRLATERVSMLLKPETCQDYVSTILAEALKEKKALEKAYKEGFDVIFNYGYSCYAFAHNICGSQIEVPDGMPDTSKLLSTEFFINPRCPPGAVPIEVASIDVRPGEAMNVPEREAPAAVLEMDNSEAGEYLSTAKVGLE